MSDIEKVVMRTRTIEKLLRTQYHAEGKGLHQLITSCEERLPHDVVAKLRFIATVRNKVVHEEDYKLDDRKGFLAACDACEKGTDAEEFTLYLASGDFVNGLDYACCTWLLLHALGHSG